MLEIVNNKEKWLEVIDKTLLVWSQREESGQLDSTKCLLCEEIFRQMGSCTGCPAALLHPRGISCFEIGEDGYPVGPVDSWGDDRDAGHGILCLLLIKEVLESGELLEDDDGM